MLFKSKKPLTAAEIVDDRVREFIDERVESSDPRIVFAIDLTEDGIATPGTANPSVFTVTDAVSAKSVLEEVQKELEFRTNADVDRVLGLPEFFVMIDDIPVEDVEVSELAEKLMKDVKNHGSALGVEVMTTASTPAEELAIVSEDGKRLRLRSEGVYRVGRENLKFEFESFYKVEVIPTL